MNIFQLKLSWLKYTPWKSVSFLLEKCRFDIFDILAPILLEFNNIHVLVDRYLWMQVKTYVFIPNKGT